MTDHNEDKLDMVSPGQVQRYKGMCRIIRNSQFDFSPEGYLEESESGNIVKWDDVQKHLLDWAAIAIGNADKADRLEKRVKELEAQIELANRKWVAEYWAGEVKSRKIADLEHTIESMKPYLHEDPEGL